MHFRSRFRLSFLFVATFATLLSGCGGITRAPQSADSLLQRRNEYLRDYLDETSQRYTAQLQRTKAQLDAYKAGHRPAPPVIDYLVISGGGDIGAFGAGFLKGWSTVPTSHPLARPTRFDVVTGVSTGALIAPFAWLGDAEADQRIVNLYRNPQTDWVKERLPLSFLPYHLSFAEVPGLERQIRETCSREMIARLTDPAEAGRLLVVNTTNLDDASPRIFYLVPEAHRAVETGDLTRFHNILLASAGIPGAFPYREIDGSMYVDGAVSANMIFGGRLPEEQRLVGLWERLYPDIPMPKLRYWVIFNNQFRFPPQVTAQKWPDIMSRATIMATQTGTVSAMRHLFARAELMKLKQKVDIEVRVMAVPDSFVPSVPGTFQNEVMNALADLGEKMGADPASWRDTPPD